MKSILEEREKENLYCVSLHSGTQMTLQFAIGFQLGTVYTLGLTQWNRNSFEFKFDDSPD